jgi:hypothetical protein
VYSHQADLSERVDWLRRKMVWLDRLQFFHFGVLCVILKSQRNCKFIQKSADMPKNLASRKAVLGVIPPRPFTSSLIL